MIRVANVPTGMTPSVSDDGRASRPSGSRTGQPVHNWRPTVVHGALLWLLLGVGFVLPLGGQFSLGLGIIALFVVPVFPVALCCDYRQARAAGECDPGLRAYLHSLGADVVTTVTEGESLGSERGRAEQC